MDNPPKARHRKKKPHSSTPLLKLATLDEEAGETPRPDPVPATGLTANEQVLPLPQPPILLQASASTSSESDEDSPVYSTVPMSPLPSPLPSPPSPLRSSSPSATFLRASAPTPVGSVPPSPAKSTASLAPYSELAPDFVSYPGTLQSDLPLPSQVSDTVTPQPASATTTVTVENQVEQSPLSIASPVVNPLEPQPPTPPVVSLAATLLEQEQPLSSVASPVVNPLEPQPLTQSVASPVVNPLEPQLPTPLVVSPLALPLVQELPLAPVALPEVNSLESQLPALSDNVPVQPEPDPVELAKRPSYTRMQSHSTHDLRDDDTEQVQIKPPIKKDRSKFKKVAGEEIDKPPRFSRKSVSHVIMELPPDWLLDSPTNRDSDETPTTGTPTLQTTNAQPNPPPVIGLDIESGHNWFYSACYGVLSNPCRSVALLIAGASSMYLINLFDKSGREFLSHFQENSYSKSDLGVTRGAGAAIAISLLALASIIKYCCGPKIYQVIESEKERSR